MPTTTALLRRAAEFVFANPNQYNIEKLEACAASLLALADQMERAEPDCWAILTPNGSRLVSEAEAKGKMKPYPLYTHPAPEVTRDAERFAWLALQGEFSAHSVPSDPHDYELHLLDWEPFPDGRTFKGNDLRSCIDAAMQEPKP